MVLKDVAAGAAADVCEEEDDKFPLTTKKTTIERIRTIAIKKIHRENPLDDDFFGSASARSMVFEKGGSVGIDVDIPP